MNYLIGISGGSGSGKSEFLKRIRQKYTESDVCLIAQDNYYHPREKQSKEDSGFVNFDRPEALDLPLFARHLAQLKRGEEVQFEEYTFNNEPSGRMVRLIPAPIIITEGTFVFHSPEVADQLDLRLYMEADFETMLKRRLDRDVMERGYEEGEIRFRFEEHFMPSYHEFVAPYKATADVIIPNFTRFDKGFELVSTHINDRLANQ